MVEDAKTRKAELQQACEERKNFMQTMEMNRKENEKLSDLEQVALLFILIIYIYNSVKLCGVHTCRYKRMSKVLCMLYVCKHDVHCTQKYNWSTCLQCTFKRIMHTHKTTSEVHAYMQCSYYVQEVHAFVYKT